MFPSWVSSPPPVNFLPSFFFLMTTLELVFLILALFWFFAFVLSNRAWKKTFDEAQRSWDRVSDRWEKAYKDAYTPSPAKPEVRISCDAKAFQDTLEKVKPGSYNFVPRPTVMTPLPPPLPPGVDTAAQLPTKPPATPPEKRLCRHCGRPLGLHFTTANLCKDTLGLYGELIKHNTAFTPLDDTAQLNLELFGTTKPDERK